ncbi:hypothetical protein JTB14_015427 [Gonioctena quinquepunctata]|nr:hypothetical protein JTB14_015427 [Gonioctena quinquepunctata]
MDGFYIDDKSECTYLFLFTEVEDLVNDTLCYGCLSDPKLSDEEVEPEINVFEQLEEEKQQKILPISDDSLIQILMFHHLSYVERVKKTYHLWNKLEQHLKKTKTEVLDLETNINESHGYFHNILSIFLLMGCITYSRIHKNWCSGMRLKIIAN